jgi:hypothetical protein
VLLLPFPLRSKADFVDCGRHVNRSRVNGSATLNESCDKCIKNDIVLVQGSSGSCWKSSLRSRVSKLRLANDTESILRGKAGEEQWRAVGRFPRGK